MRAKQPASGSTVRKIGKVTTSFSHSGDAAVWLTRVALTLKCRPHFSSGRMPLHTNDHNDVLWFPQTVPLQRGDSDRKINKNRPDITKFTQKRTKRAILIWRGNQNENKYIRSDNRTNNHMLKGIVGGLSKHKSRFGLLSKHSFICEFYIKSRHGAWSLTHYLWNLSGNRQLETYDGRTV